MSPQRRLHTRTPENRERWKHSIVYRGFDVWWHPDSWEFSYEPRPGAGRVYLGAQFSVRRAIDDLLREQG